MAGWRGWFRSSRDSEWARHARQLLTAAFLDMDRRQSIADAGVHASDQMFPDQHMAARWEPVRTRCYAAAGAYLTMIERLDAIERTDTAVSQPEIDLLVRHLGATAQAIDEFYRGHQAHLEHAVTVQSAVPQLAQQVRDAAEQAHLRVADSEYSDYPSVRRAVTALNETLVLLDEALAQGHTGAVRNAANRADVATTSLVEALEAAPGQQYSATTAIASATTRLAAVRHRQERIGPAYSTLLREFNAASSADLADNERESQRTIAAAAADLTRARAALAENNPENARESTMSARKHLADAEEKVDAVTERLTLLREVRADPQEKAKAVRFRVRDAQMLAVELGLATEWGSVLDAQAERLDRISATLTGRHPDYWAYLAELDTVSVFIAGVVERMRRTEPGSI